MKNNVCFGSYDQSGHVLNESSNILGQTEAVNYQKSLFHIIFIYSCFSKNIQAYLMKNNVCFGCFMTSLAMHSMRWLLAMYSTLIDTIAYTQLFVGIDFKFCSRFACIIRKYDCSNRTSMSRL